MVSRVRVLEAESYHERVHEFVIAAADVGREHRGENGEQGSALLIREDEKGFKQHPSLKLRSDGLLHHVVRMIDFQEVESPSCLYLLSAVQINLCLCSFEFFGQLFGEFVLVGARIVARWSARLFIDVSAEFCLQLSQRLISFFTPFTRFPYLLCCILFELVSMICCIVFRRILPDTLCRSFAHIEYLCKLGGVFKVNCL